MVKVSLTRASLTQPLPTPVTLVQVPITKVSIIEISQAYISLRDQAPPVYVHVTEALQLQTSPILVFLVKIPLAQAL